MTRLSHAPTGAASTRILTPGRNCWRIGRADRFGCIQDAAEYFRLVRQALLEARHTVFILGWDIWSHLDLLPDAPETDPPSRLDTLLDYIARRRPELRCYILIWDYGVLYSLERDPLSRWRLGWRSPRGIRFGFDEHHPLGASHHQKVIVIDDQLAFCGGIDLTGHRWDTSAHRVEEPARITAIGSPYGPYHEVQAMATGPIASALGELARERWRTLGERDLPEVNPSADDHWPADIEPDLVDVCVGIARTMPPSDGGDGVRECEALFEDSIARARRSIYIENQYFSSEAMAAALAVRLREADGPEVILVEPRDCHGWLEENTMGAFRARAHRRLIDADTHGRLRLVHPLVSRRDDACAFVHSKVMIVDDVLVRIGSANLSQRSMGMDSECDVAAEAADDGQRAAIHRIRHRLLAEHMGLPIDRLEHELTRATSVRALIDARAGENRTLDALTVPANVDMPSEVLRAAADPDEPMAFGSTIEALIPRVDTGPRPDPMRVWMLPSVALAAGGIVAWTSVRGVSPEMRELRDLVLALAGDRHAFNAGVVTVAVAGVALVPVELLAVGAGALFGGLAGGAMAFTGSCGAASVGYVAGRRLGPQGLSRWLRTRDYRSARQLGTRGLGGVVALRLAGLASTGAINLICGAGRVPFPTYLAGTAIAFVPLVALLSGLGALLRRTLTQPSVAAAAITIAATVGLMAVTSLVRAFFVMRQFAPTVSRHRNRAEFG